MVGEFHHLGTDIMCEQLHHCSQTAPAVPQVAQVWSSMLLKCPWRSLACLWRQEATETESCDWAMRWSAAQGSWTSQAVASCCTWHFLECEIHVINTNRRDELVWSLVTWLSVLRLWPSSPPVSPGRTWFTPQLQGRRKRRCEVIVRTRWRWCLWIRLHFSLCLL